MTRYFIVSDETERGPISFRELVVAVQAGQVVEHSLVRSEHDQNMIPAEDVPGLFREARKAGSVRPAEQQAAMLEDESSRATIGRTGKREPGTDARGKAAVQTGKPVGSVVTPPAPMSRLSFALAGIAGLIGIVVLWWLFRPVRFPQPSSAAMAQGMELSLVQMRAPAVSPATLEISKSAAVLVPGLENESGVSSPSLSADLRSIVFLKPSLGQDDVYLATRLEKAQPFEAPVRLGCSSRYNDAFCSLSPDGTELLFTVQGNPSRIFYASSADEFGTAEPLIIDGFDADEQHLDNAQWMTDNRMHFASGDQEFTERVQHIAERSGPGSAFRVTRELPLQNPWPRMHLSANGERAYFPRKFGIVITAAKMQMEEFGIGRVLLSQEVVGPLDESLDESLDDPLFVVPQEDVMFFTGPWKSEDGNVMPGRLWMIGI